MELKEISYAQIFTYFEFKVGLKTSFSLVFYKPELEYVVFLNKENDNSISVLDVKNKGIILKDDLLMALSPEIKYSQILPDIKEVSVTINTTLTEEITIDDLLAVTYGFMALDKGNRNLTHFSTTEFLFNGGFPIYQDDQENLITPISNKGHISNYYITNSESNKLKYKDSVGFFMTKYRPENTYVLISFNLNTVLDYLQEDVFLKSQVIIPNCNASMLYVFEILNSIENNAFKPHVFKFLYSTNSLQELASTLLFFVNMCNIMSSFKFSCELDLENKINLNVIIPKGYKMLEVFQFYANLNNDLYEVLGIDPKDEIKAEILNKYKFDILTNELASEINIITFFPKIELIQILLKNLNYLLFGRSSKYEFLAIKKPSKRLINVFKDYIHVQ